MPCDEMCSNASACVVLLQDSSHSATQQHCCRLSPFLPKHLSLRWRDPTHRCSADGVVLQNVGGCTTTAGRVQHAVDTYAIGAQLPSQARHQAALQDASCHMLGLGSNVLATGASIARIWRQTPCGPSCRSRPATGLSCSHEINGGSPHSGTVQRSCQRCQTCSG